MFEETHLEVPRDALQKPAGAARDAAGLVACLSCSTKVSPSQADIVGDGYRCSRCSHQAQLASLQGGIDPHTGVDTRGIKSAANGAMVAGAAFLALGVLLLLATDGTIGMYITAGGVFSMIGAWARRSG